VGDRWLSGRLSSRGRPSSFSEGELSAADGEEIAVIRAPEARPQMLVITNTMGRAGVQGPRKDRYRRYNSTLLTRERNFIAGTPGNRFIFFVAGKFTSYVSMVTLAALVKVGESG
jgi:hypothetical protein